MRRWIGLWTAALLGLVSCGDDSSCPTCPQQTFAFRIAVRDAAGAAVPGLRVSLLYPPLPGFPGIGSPDVQAPPAATGGSAPLDGTALDAGTRHPSALHATIVLFAAPDTAIATLDVLDLARRFVAQPLSSYPVIPGLHTVAVAPEAPYGVYWIRLVARRGGAIAFRDSLLAAWWPIDPNTNVLGSTDADGVLQTSDALRFPNVLDLPPLVRTNVNGDSLGTFSYPDTVAIVLTAPPGGPFEQVSVYRLVVAPGVNDFRLQWPNAAKPGGAVEPVGDIDTSAPPVGGPPAGWRLYRNTPNPVD